MRFAGYVCLMLFVVAEATAQVWTPPEIPEQSVNAARPAPITVSVNCGAGQKIQDAVDGNPSPIEILISGICIENVLIRDKDVSLRGINSPSLDGIRPLAPSTPSLIVRGPVEGTIQNLSFNDAAAAAVSVRGANMAFVNCRFENNGIGLQVTLDGNVTASGLTFANNAGRAIGVTDSQLFCTACDISGSSFAVLANRGAIVSLLDSVVTGGRGIAATDGGTIADLDCVSLATAHPCSMTVTGAAAQAVGGATVVLVGAGDFTGQLVAFDQGTVEILGSRQTVSFLSSTPANVADYFGRIIVAAFPDVSPPLQSRLRSTNASHFAQILATDNTIIDGPVTLSGAAQSYFDPTVTVRVPSR